MKNLIAISALVFALGTITPVLAQTSSSTEPSANSAATIACVGAAVNTRETAIDSAVAAHAQAVTAAYTARAAALKEAYTLTNPHDVSKAVKAAWKTFRTSTKSAAKDWRTAQRAAWSTFKTASRACHPTEGISDNGNSGTEISGQ